MTIYVSYCKHELDLDFEFWILFMLSFESECNLEFEGEHMLLIS
jgi:hypothetical protein